MNIVLIAAYIFSLASYIYLWCFLIPFLILVLLDFILQKYPMFIYCFISKFSQYAFSYSCVAMKCCSLCQITETQRQVWPGSASQKTWDMSISSKGRATFSLVIDSVPLRENSILDFVFNILWSDFLKYFLSCPLGT